MVKVLYGIEGKWDWLVGDRRRISKEGRLNGWMDGQMDEWMDGRLSFLKDR